MAEVVARGSICGKCIPARYVLAVLGSIAMAITYGLKVNLSIAMVGMLNHTAITSQHPISASTSGLNVNVTNIVVHSECMPATSSSNSSEVLEDGPFDWSEALQGSILSSYFWGYILAQLPGARVAELFSAKWVMLVSVAVNIVCTLFTPLSAKLHYSVMILMRIFEGLAGGVTFPAMHVLLAHWAPPAERSIMSSITYAGTSLGTVISILSAGVLAATLGWESVFYVMGAVCVIWCALWIWLIQDYPNQQTYISAEERDLIVNSLETKTSNEEHDKQKVQVPWRSVFTSKPFWAILVSHICSNWGWYMILIELPFYMKQVLFFNIKENAVLTAIPFFAMWLFSMVISKYLDYLRGKKIITTTIARKIATITASAVPAVILLSLCYIGCVRWLAVLLMTIAVTAKGGMFCGFLSNHIDIAPNFAGTLVAITNTMATIPGIIVPLFVGYLTHGNQTIDAWRIIFFVTVVLYVIEMIIYGLFGSGEQQAWNRFNKTDGLKEQEEQPLNQTQTAYKSTQQE